MHGYRILSRAAGVALAMTAMANPGLAATASRAPFGALADGTRVEAVTLGNAHGVTARIMTLARPCNRWSCPTGTGMATISCWAMTRRRNISPIRIISAPRSGAMPTASLKGKFTLDGKGYTLETNDGPNHLHGGAKGFDKRMWKIESVTSGAEASVAFSYVSADGEAGYPANCMSPRPIR